MIRILSLKKQNDIMQRLIRIILELRKSLPADAAKDALDDAFEIALVVGGQEMLETMTGTRVQKYHRSVMDEIGDGLSRCVEIIDEVSGSFEK